MAPTPPGTLTNVTPLKDVPIIPKATSIQLLLRLPMKKDSLFELREVYQATVRRSAKYPMTHVNKRVGDIVLYYTNLNELHEHEFDQHKLRRPAAIGILEHELSRC